MAERPKDDKGLGIKRGIEAQRKKRNKSQSVIFDQVPRPTWTIKRRVRERVEKSKKGKNAPLAGGSLFQEESTRQFDEKGSKAFRRRIKVEEMKGKRQGDRCQGPLTETEVGRKEDLQVGRGSLGKEGKKLKRGEKRGERFPTAPAPNEDDHLGSIQKHSGKGGGGGGGGWW